MKAQDWEAAKLDAAVLGHYVADAHDPLHTTQNFNGQLTGETGLEQRFADRLVEHYTNFLIFHASETTKINDPTEHGFEMALEANTWVDRIILADRQCRDDLPDYNDDYLDRFYARWVPSPSRSSTAPPMIPARTGTPPGSTPGVRSCPATERVRSSGSLSSELLS